ncbi:Elicitin-like protein brl5, partial [Globisporangium splendens]
MDSRRALPSPIELAELHAGATRQNMFLQGYASFHSQICWQPVNSQLPTRRNAEHFPRCKAMMMMTKLLVVSSVLLSTATTMAATTTPCTIEQLMSYMTTPYTKTCMAQSGLDFTKLTGSPTNSQLTSLCQTEACNQLVKEVLAKNPVDCLLPVGGLTFVSGLLEPIRSFCATGTGSDSTTSSSSMSSSGSKASASSSSSSEVPKPATTAVNTVGKEADGSSGGDRSGSGSSAVVGSVKPTNTTHSGIDEGVNAGDSSSSTKPPSAEKQTTERPSPAPTATKSDAATSLGRASIWAMLSVSAALAVVA